MDARTSLPPRCASTVLRVLLLGTAVLFAGCSATVEKPDGPPRESIDVSQIPDAVPQDEPLSRYGNPESYEVFGRRYYTMRSAHGYVEQGIASWYGTKFHGRRTSSGETYDMYGMTAAHKSLPLPTYVEVTNLHNGRKAVLKVNDRGPFVDNRIIDLSYAAARKLGIVANGTGLVEVRAVDPRAPRMREADSRLAAAPQPVSTPSSQAAIPAFYLQIGAFSQRDNAEQLRRTVSTAAREAVEISESRNPSGVVYRVRVGPLASVEAADQVVAALASLGIQDHHVVLP